MKERARFEEEDNKNYDDDGCAEKESSDSEDANNDGCAENRQTGNQEVDHDNSETDRGQGGTARKEGETIARKEDRADSHQSRIKQALPHLLEKNKEIEPISVGNTQDPGGDGDGDGDDELTLSGTTTSGECISTHEDTIMNVTQVNSILAHFDFVPPPMPLPRSSSHQCAIPSSPGAFHVTASGGLAYTTIRRDTGTAEGAHEQHHVDTTTTNEEGLEMVHQQDLCQQQQQQPSNHSELVQAWPISAPLTIATPEQWTQDPGNSIFVTIPFLSSNPNWKFLLVAAMVGLVSILASSVAIPFLFSNKDPNQIEHMRIKETVLNTFGMDYFDNKQKEKALQWIVYEDPQHQSQHQLLVKEDSYPTNLMQRFSLVSFYFQTSAQQEWAYCNPPVGKQTDTCFYREAGARSDKIGIRWLTAAHECEWMGVSCAVGTWTVTDLYIYNNNMTGTLPADEIANLSHLKVLILLGNNLTDPLSETLFARTTMETIMLTGNHLSGNIPTQAFSLPHLTNLLDNNELTGSIPSEVGSFPGQILRLASNLLTGSISEDMYRATMLQRLHLADNMLTGTLSSAIGALTGLIELLLSGNLINGTIPSEIGLLQVRGLYIERSNMKGTIPEEIFRNTLLEYLMLSGNKLSGTISTRIGRLSNLVHFEIADNSLHGTLPTQLSRLTKLHTFRVNGNINLTGSIPERLCSQVHQGCNIVADCTPTATKGVPSVYCPQGCCSSCCDAETKICLEQ